MPLRAKICRDCGSEIKPNARGCSTCALNLEAESMIDHFIWRQFMPIVIIVAAVAAVLIYFLR
jgi:hypothetical protein